MSANNLMPYVTRVASGKLEKLRDKRKPLTKREIKKLSDILFELDIDMREELTEIEIDETLPRIEVPPKQLEEHLRNHDLDPNISTEPLQLFSDGHFNEAVRKAAERLEDFVQEVSNLELSGRDLVMVMKNAEVRKNALRCCYSLTGFLEVSKQLNNSKKINKRFPCKICSRN